MKLLVTGAGGQVGWELARSLMPLGEVVAFDRETFDFTAPERLREQLASIAPDVIVNAAAYTAVDRAESEPELAHAINATAVGVIGDVARGRGALVIHYSTDYVFDGSSARPYLETDSPAPANVYGRTKLAGERALAASGADHLILRTSWVFAARGQNFVLTVLRLAAERPQLRIVADQHGAPTWARNIADATAHLVHAASAERRAGRFASAILNCTSSGSTTWHGFASRIVEASAARGLLDPARLPRVDAIGSRDYPTPAARPLNSRLDPAALEARYGITLPAWQSALDACLDELAGRAR